MDIRESDIEQRIADIEKQIAEYDLFVFPPEGRRITRQDIAKFEIRLMSLGRKLELEGILYSGKILGV